MKMSGSKSTSNVSAVDTKFVLFCLYLPYSGGVSVKIAVTYGFLFIKKAAMSEITWLFNFNSRWAVDLSNDNINL